MSFAKMPVLRRGLMLRHSDIYNGAVLNEREESLKKLLARKDAECAVLYSNPANSAAVCYLTNYNCYGAGRQSAVFFGGGEKALYTTEPGRNLPKVREFTFCDIEKGRKPLQSVCARALEYAKNGRIAVAGREYMPLQAREELDKAFASVNLIDIDEELGALLATPDESALEATRKAHSMARDGMALVEEKLKTGRGLQEIAADVDYSLRLAGCEDANILLDSGTGRALRPRLPVKAALAGADTVIAYVAVQFARRWGSVGRTLTKNGKKSAMGDLREKIAVKAFAGLTLAQCEDEIRRIASADGVSLAADLPIIRGTGMDPEGYPNKAAHRIGEGMLLQLVLADDDGFTYFSSEMLIAGGMNNNFLR